jgi:hypothetical protein
MMPHPAAVQAIAQAFDVNYPPMTGWVEEYAPGEYCINLVNLSVAQ